jgi:hypothetical protein
MFCADFFAEAELNCVASSMLNGFKNSRLIVVCLVSAALLLFVVALRFRAKSVRAITPGIKLPATIIWAWERPEHLEFVNPQQVGVAFLARTIYLRGDEVVSRPRMQPLALPAGARLIAVARIETDRAQTPTLSDQQLQTTLAELSKLGALENVSAVQIDFDATTSERNFYRALLVRLRQELAQTKALSITALASWCAGDNWLDDVPIDEAVPMLFRMGIDRRQFVSRLAAGEQFNAKQCSASAGVSTDEPLTDLPAVKRLYVFNPEPWSQAALNETLETYRR